MDDLRQAILALDCPEDAVQVAPDRGLRAGNGGLSEVEGTEQRMARLVRTIEGEIIPRLMLAHRVAPAYATVPALDGARPGAEEVAELSRLILEHDAAVALYYVERLLAQGILLETLYLDLLAPVARHLGALWEEDLCDFTDVTVGLCRLHQMLRELSPAFRNEVEHQDGRRALLAPAPGEQHGFGLVMVGEFFRRAGWDVWNGPAARGELVEMVRSDWFAVVGFSMSCGSRLDALASTIRAVRRASLNPDIGIMVGGSIFIAHPDLVALVGADATAADAPQAVARAEDMLALLARRL